MSSSRPPSPPSSDPEARWNLRRAAWLARRKPLSETATDDSARAKDPVFAARLQLLDDMLSLPHEVPPPPPLSRSSNRLPPPLVAMSPPPPPLLSGNSSAADGKGKGRELNKEELDLMELEPDGGDVIARRKLDAAALSKADSERAIDGIMTAFRLGRALKEPLPLAIVTKLLYRQWWLDGTIPPDYEPTPHEPTPTPTPDEYPRPARPHWLMSSTSSNSTTPPPLPVASGFAEWVPPAGRVGGDVAPPPKLEVHRLNSSTVSRQEADVASGEDVL